VLARAPDRSATPKLGKSDPETVGTRGVKDAAGPTVGTGARRCGGESAEQLTAS
jgi:hypothetical protein